MWREGGQCLETFPLSPSMESLTSASDLQLNQVHSTRLVFPGVDFKVGGGGVSRFFDAVVCFIYWRWGVSVAWKKRQPRLLKVCMWWAGHTSRKNS